MLHSALLKVYEALLRNLQRKQDHCKYTQKSLFLIKKNALGRSTFCSQLNQGQFYLGPSSSGAWIKTSAPEARAMLLHQASDVLDLTENIFVLESRNGFFGCT